jgi:4-amino-4-deoxychorismate lyase
VVELTAPAIAAAPMLATAPVLATLVYHPDGSPAGHRLADAGSPQLSVLDLAATRGDGVFETISLGRGRLQALSAHLARFEHSAAMLDLPRPDLEQWLAAIRDVAAVLNERVRTAGGTALDDGFVTEGFVKIVLSRGVEGAAGSLNPGAIPPTGWALAAVSPDHSAAREHGIRIILLDRGYRHDIAQTSPWLLAGAKTLSYAINRGVFREAARRGADDAVWVSTDGYLLEGAVSNLVLQRGNRLLTPRTDLGILAGTTQADIFRWAESRGWATEYALLTADDLMAADSAWLVSSGRHAAPIRRVDAEPRPIDVALTREINDYLRSRVD